MLDPQIVALLMSMSMLVGALVTGVTALVAFRTGRRVGRRDAVVLHHNVITNRSSRHREATPQ